MWGQETGLHFVPLHAFDDCSSADRIYPNSGTEFILPALIKGFDWDRESHLSLHRYRVFLVVDSLSGKTFYEVCNEVISLLETAVGIIA